MAQIHKTLSGYSVPWKRAEHEGVKRKDDQPYPGPTGYMADIAFHFKRQLRMAHGWIQSVLWPELLYVQRIACWQAFLNAHKIIHG